MIEEATKRLHLTLVMRRAWFTVHVHKVCVLTNVRTARPAEGSGARETVSPRARICHMRAHGIRLGRANRWKAALFAQGGSPPISAYPSSPPPPPPLRVEPSSARARDSRASVVLLVAQVELTARVHLLLQPGRLGRVHLTSEAPAARCQSVRSRHPPAAPGFKCGAHLLPASKERARIASALTGSTEGRDPLSSSACSFSRTALSTAGATLRSGDASSGTARSAASKVRLTLDMLDPRSAWARRVRRVKRCGAAACGWMRGRAWPRVAARACVTVRDRAPRGAGRRGAGRGGAGRGRGRANPSQALQVRALRRVLGGELRLLGVRCLRRARRARWSARRPRGGRSTLRPRVHVARRRGWPLRRLLRRLARRLPARHLERHLARHVLGLLGGVRR